MSAPLQNHLHTILSILGYIVGFFGIIILFLYSPEAALLVTSAILWIGIYRVVYNLCNKS